MDDEKRTVNSVPIIFALVLGAAASYVGGYFAMSSLIDGPGWRMRTFPAQWLCEGYRPAAMVESRLTGDSTDLRSK